MVRLFFLLSINFFLNSHLFCMDNPIEIESYSNEKPKLMCLSTDVSDPFRILEEAGFKECPYLIYPYASYAHSYHIDSHKVYVKLDENLCFETACYVKYQIREVIIPDLGKTDFYGNDIMESAKKWDIPREIPSSDCFSEEDEPSKIFSLSWSYIDYILHEYNSKIETAGDFIKTSLLEEKLFYNIKNKGLKKSFSRFLYQSNEKKSAFYIAIDDHTKHYDNYFNLF